MDLFDKISKWVKLKVYSDESETSNTKFHEYKILILGDKSVGKTSFCNRFCQNEFSLEVKPSTANEAYLKILKLYDETIKLYIIDTIEAVLSNDRKELYNDVKGVIILYDITKLNTFEKIDKWIIDVKQHINPTLPIVLIGHKKDLTFLRNVDYEEGQDKANKTTCDFIETTCLDDDSVDSAIKLITAKIYYQDMPESKKTYLKLSLNEKDKEDKEDTQN